MSELSIFIDETGDSGTNSNYYLVTFLFHDQSKTITEQIDRLSLELDNIGFPKGTAVHTYPIIRKENEYQNLPLALRRRVIDKITSLICFIQAIRADCSTAQTQKASSSQIAQENFLTKQ